MEAQLFETLYRLVFSVAHWRRPRTQFPDQVIVLVYLWSVLHDRPVYWACQRANWPRELEFELPEDSTMSRRLRSLSVQQLLERVLAAGSDLLPIPLAKALDSKPLYVGPYSKDRDAKRGRVAAGQFARGYRLHTLNHGRIVRHFVLGPMNEHDAKAAPALIQKLEQGGYAVADNAYDSNALHRQAAAVNHQLVAPPRAANRGVRDLKHNCSQRLRTLDLLDSPLKACGLSPQFGPGVYGCRQQVESGYGGLTFLGLH